MFGPVEIKHFFLSLLGFSSVTQPNPNFEMWSVFAVAVFVAFFVRVERFAENGGFGSWRAVVQNIVFSILFVAVLLFIDRSENFIYFRF